jgi:hypothetical protein
MSDKEKEIGANDPGALERVNKYVFTSNDAVRARHKDAPRAMMPCRWARRRVAASSL